MKTTTLLALLALTVTTHAIPERFERPLDSTFPADFGEFTIDPSGYGEFHGYDLTGNLTHAVLWLQPEAVHLFLHAQGGASREWTVFAEALPEPWATPDQGWGIWKGTHVDGVKLRSVPFQPVPDTGTTGLMFAIGTLVLLTAKKW